MTPDELAKQDYERLVGQLVNMDFKFCEKGGEREGRVQGIKRRMFSSDVSNLEQFEKDLQKARQVLSSILSRHSRNMEGAVRTGNAMEIMEKKMDPRQDLQHQKEGNRTSDILGEARKLMNVALETQNSDVIGSARMLLVSAYRTMKSQGAPVTKSQADTFAEQDIEAIRNARASARMGSLSAAKSMRANTPAEGESKTGAKR